MSDFFFRTEDISPEEVGRYFVESKKDREIVDELKSKNPTILIGSRGVGKSFLLRVAQKELLDSFESKQVFPVYLSFVKSSLVQGSDPDRFRPWMISRIASATIRSLLREGKISSLSRTTRELVGAELDSTKPTKLEEIADAFEASWKTTGPVDSSSVPTIDALKNALEDLSDEIGIKRFVLLFDEAAHIFLPEQQRQFFALFRDLRSHCVTCNAAVYPGVTSFGDAFQPAHDATMLVIERDVLASDYLGNMREIVEKQADASTLTNIARNSQNFAILCYAASGNPRILLKTLHACPRLNAADVNNTIREFYRTQIWAEHSTLAEKYTGHREIIDWGRKFCENEVLPDLKQKNDQNLNLNKNTSCFIWIHRDATVPVKEALRVLSYTGILSERGTGIKASRSEIGIRYSINLGCLVALEPRPAASAFEIVKGLAPKRMSEFGINHPAFKQLSRSGVSLSISDGSDALKEQLRKPISVLDLTEWQRSKLLEIELSTVRDVLDAPESKLKEANYVGDVRARRIKNAVLGAVMEYLSG